MILRAVDVPGFGPMQAYTCAVCGEETIVGPIEASPGFGTIDQTELIALVAGDPPVCPECRGGPT